MIALNFWANNAASTQNLRLFIPGNGWRNYADRLNADGNVEERGARDLIDSAFINALNSSNMLMLSGTGTSFCATNPAGFPQCPSMAALWDAVHAGAGEQLFTWVLAQFPNASVNRNIEKLLSVCKIFLELHENSPPPPPDAVALDQVNAIRQFVGNSERTILQCVDFVRPQTLLEAHSDILRKISRRGVRKPRAKIFTTNYDLCFEEAARRIRFTVIDGFSHSIDQVYDRSYYEYDLVRRDPTKDAPDYAQNVFQLYKLHGSRDWRKVDGEILRTRAEVGSPVLIYPRSSKYQEAFEPPYLDMFGAFQAALREQDVSLIIAGFGFNDDHISRPILAALEANVSMRLIVCDPMFIAPDHLVAGTHDLPGNPATYNSFLARLYRLAEAGDSRVHLINGRFDDMALALPDLMGETDRERHSERVRILRDERR